MLFFLLAHRRSINFPLDLLTDNKVFVAATIARTKLHRDIPHDKYCLT